MYDVTGRTRAVADEIEEGVCEVEGVVSFLSGDRDRIHKHRLLLAFRFRYSHNN